MEFQSRSYNPGPVYRPKPFVLKRPDSSLMVVTTSWSAQSDAEKAAQMIADFVEQAEPESGRDLESRLKKAMTMTGQLIYKQDNQRQVRLLIEALAVRIEGNSVAWAQVGQPNLYLLRKGRLAPLVVQADHALLDAKLPPLPSLGLGLEAQTAVQAGSASYQPGDRLLLMAQSWEPSWVSAPETEISFQKITAGFIERQPDQGFWCGELSIPSSR